jgi:hypothetical protein
VTQRLTASELVAELEQLLGMVHQLSPPLNRRPALFLEQKDELGNRIMTLIRRMGAESKTPTSFCAKQDDAGASLVRVGTRSIPMEPHQRR